MHNLKAKNRQLEEKESELSKSLKQLRTSQLELNKSYDLLKEKQDQLEALASNVPGVIFNMEIFQNAIVNFKYVSPRAFEFFECEEVDIMLDANLLLDQIMPEFRKDIYADLLSNHKETSQIAPEFKILTPKGQEKWLKAEMLISPTNNKTKQINGVFLDISEEKKQETIKEKIRKSLLNIPNDDCIVSGDILKALKLITDTAKDTLGVNSVSIWLLDKEPTPQLLCYEHTSDKEFDYAREPLSLSEIELFLTTLEKDKVVVADDAHSHPVTKELYAHNLRPAFIKSTLDADIILKGTFQGVICCGHSSKRHWAQDEVQYLNSLSDIISLALEIHERKKTESEIQRAYSLIISVFDAVEEGLMVVGSDHETLECNNRFIEMFKVPPALLNKENRRLRIRYIADQLINGDDFMEKLSSMEASNEHEFFNVLHLRDKRAIEQFSQPFYVQGKFMGRIWSYRDITKSLQAEESLRTVNSELDTFIYRASHDIKGPLARLRGICDVAKMTIKDAQANVYLKLLDLESRKLDSILEKLLVVKDLKTNNIKIEKINFNEVLDKSIKHLKYVQDFENIHIKVQVDNTLEFKSDGNLLELVFMNLIDNAIQFRDENKPSTNISIDIYPENNFVTVCIKDNGIGMEETILNQIFDMHFRGNERSTGTGLGLYIVKTAIDALNGKIQVNSKISVGTEFVFSLPYKMMNKSLMV
ncbi:MAG TPA: hypothetical protein DCR46_03510 [Cytophagales bacterium]|nr:hypothetical protein [Cytophagales bacterium]